MKKLTTTSVLLAVAYAHTASADCSTTASTTTCTEAPGEITTQVRSAGHRSTVSTSSAGSILLGRDVISYGNTTIVVGRDLHGKQQMMSKGSTLLNPTPTIPAPQFRPVNYSTPPTQEAGSANSND